MNTPEFDVRNIKTRLSVWAWMMFAFAANLGFILQVLTIILPMGFDRNRMLSGRIFSLATVVSAKLNPLWQFSVFEMTIEDLSVLKDRTRQAVSVILERIQTELNTPLRIETAALCMQLKQ